jgi:membrane fusion protein, multidrug efflux system
MADQQDVDVRTPPKSLENPPAASPASTDLREQSDQGISQQRDEQRARRRSWLIRALFLVAVIILVIAGTLYHQATKNLVSTDDAFTEGRAVTVAPRVSGYVVALAVNDNQRVNQGDLLLQIDPRDYQIARDQAAAQLEVAQAQLVFAQAALEKARVTFPAQLDAARGNLETAQGQLFKAESDYRRQHSIPRAATTQEQVDASTAALQQARGLVAQTQAQVTEAEPVPQNISQAEAQAHQLEGQVAQAKAQLAQAELNLSYTRLVAAQPGYVTKRNVEVGDYAQPGASLLSLVTPEVWVTANFKEDQLARLRQGQKATIAVDAYPQLKLRGHVDSLQLGSGSKFTAFPPENATGNFVKIVQRVPVKILIDSGLDPNLPLPLGISVEPTVDVASQLEAAH